MKIKFRHTRVFTFLLPLLLLCGVANHAWAAGHKVTYHILTLPIVNSIYHMDGSGNVINGKRLEAIRVVVNNATTVGLPDEYKSPLAKNFTYYLDTDANIEKHDAVAMYNYAGDKNKTRYYDIKAGATAINTAEYTVPSDINVYVTYQYDDSKGVDLSGATEYNLTMSGGFLAFNRGRNNRVAVFKKDLNLVKAEDLVSEDFVQFPYTNDNKIAGTNISTFWKDNKTPKATVAGQFHFIFKLEGSDPYNIIIGTAYNKDYAYLEKHGSETSFYYKWYKGSHLFRPSSDGTGFFMSSDEHKKYIKSGGTYDPNVTVTESDTEEATGYFKSKGKDDLTYGTFALLNSTSASGGYVFMVSRFINGNGDLSTPGDYKSAKYNYLTRDGNYNNLTYYSLTLSDASKNYSTDSKIYRVQNYVFKVKKHITNEVLSVPVRLSEYVANGNPINVVPEELKRKYANFTGAYKEESLSTPFATFAEVDANATTETIDGKDYKVIWLKYETNMPFEAWKVADSDANSNGNPDYDELKWYNMHAEKNTKYIVSWDKDNSRIETRNSDVKYGYGRKTHYAFIGDPYDLRIVGRVSSEDENGDPLTLKYMKLNATLEKNTTFETTWTTWGIVYDDDTADNKDCFRLKDNSGTKYLHINASGTNYPLNGTATLSEAVRITVDKLTNKNYIYYIMRSDGTIAAMSQASHEPSAKLGYDFIPSSIRSPFIKDVALTFYGSYTGTDGGDKAKGDAAVPRNAITYAKDTEDGNLQYIVVRYTFNETTSPTNFPKINGESSATFNVRLNGQFIYYDINEEVEANRIKSSATIGGDATRDYNWTLGGRDPYAMTIKPQSVNKYIKIDSWPDDDEGEGATVSWSDTPPTSKYIIKSSTEENTYEVMGATGEVYDAMESSFNFGRPTDNTVRMYGDWIYLSGSDVLRFELVPTTARTVTYRLVDIKKNEVLLSVDTRQASTDAPSFPPEYRSPLVDSDKYLYWSSLDNAKSRSGVHPATVGASGDIYVTYTANNRVDMSGRTLYLMKFALGDQFRQEDGSDGLLDPIPAITGTDEEKKQIAEANKYRYQAVYPYCNGDCNFFVYGQEQYDEQQQGAASTRTRWAWYVESVKNDPYHVKIRSRQQETYPAGSGNDYNAYFRTYKPNGYSEVVTTLAWPGISGEQGTEYMVLGSDGQFRLVTTYGIDLNNDGDRDDSGEDVRRAVNSFEQYWKTWNTIRLKVLGDKDAVAKQSDPNTVPATPATDVATAANKNNRTYLTDVMKWHSYENWAYAIRWNDYNKDGDKNKKGWESIEHWYQTVNMGEGYFDFVKTTIDPVLILLDQHGWEVMRKPLPSSPDDPDKFAKYEALGLYDSPMVKEYAFWKTAKKRTGFHQYYLLSDRIGGEDFTSTSLTDLPPYDSENVKDAKGNLLDQYVTYIVKDEYAQTYNPSSKMGQPFLIQQGTHFAYNNSDAATVGKEDVPATGGMSQYIISNISDLTTTGDKKDKLWYVKPNTDIDIEMGYQDATKFPTGYAHNWDSKTPNAYEDSKYSALKAAVYVKETTEYKNASADDKKKLTDKYGEFSFSNGFDPYNIQISSVSNGEKFFVTNATKAEIDEGSILGDGTNNNLKTLNTEEFVKATLKGGMDNRTLQITNATFMAVQDEDGNMQLMPRFDNEKRLKDFSALVHTDDSEVAKTYTKLYRPLVYNYHIIDNSGQEALHYQGGGDLVPQTPEWFQSQLAKDYTYHTAKPCTNENLITESLEGASLTEKNVYVRYSYDETADYNKILQGKWLTMTVNGKDAVYSEGVKQGGSKPDPVDALHKDWQWKFLANSQTDPDPYSVSLYNRNTAAGTPTTVNEKTKFVLLNWYDGNGVDPNAYTLAVHGTGTSGYDFVNGHGVGTYTMSESNAATTATEANVKSTSCSYTDTDAKIELNDDVSHTYTYKVYTNDDPVTPAHGGKYGNFAVSASQDYFTVSENDYVPILPEEIRSPLLNIDQFKYYGAEADMGDATKELRNIFGLYDDVIYVRYTAYDLNKTKYKVPNVKTVVDSKVARGETSNDASLDINNELLYNVIWYNDNMMQSLDNATITGPFAHEPLKGGDAYVWKFEGNDPYAIKIKHNKSGKYAVGADALAGGATSTFMLLPSTDSDWQYGVLQVTGGTDKLSGHGHTTVAAEPTKFIIFGLSTHTVIYHLVIANIGSSETIPYSASNDPLDERYTPGNELVIQGSTNRDLTTGGGTTYQLGETKTTRNLTYCVDAGHITLGDPLKVPEELERPNCKYFYYVEGVYTDEDCDRSSHVDATLDNKYRGLQITQMGTEPELLGKTVLINVEYQFNDGLPTNNGSDFVTDPSQKKWFTWETSDDKLAQYTGAAGFKMLEGHESHYTNDFLWSPVGDPYGFKMYNRYEYKTNGATTHVMTTEATPADGGIPKLLENTDFDSDHKYASNAIYELFAGDTDGYFFVRPMLNNDVAIYNDGGTMKLSATNATEYTFGLSLELLKPYYDRAGYVGGLTPGGKTAYENANGNLQTIQGVVYNDENIVKFTPGYYRLHSQPDIKDLPQRYLSGYTHKTELTPGTGTDLSPVAIPMHFYEKKGVTTTFEALGSGFTTTAATQGQLPIVAPEYDPASIFHITGTLNGSNNALSTATMSTQGLNVIENHMGTGTATSFTLMDIGGAVLLIHDNKTPNIRKYLNFDQSAPDKIYDIQWKNDTPTDYAKWCLEPANNMGLYIETHSGGEEETLTDLWYYSSYCVPFDLLIADKEGEDKDHSSNAYTCISTESTWPGTTEAARVGLHPKPIGKYNTGTYKNNDYFVPAGTPVLFSTKRAKDYIKATIPATSPSSPISTIFSAKYLEQKLSDTFDDSQRVYVFGPKMQGTVSIDTSEGSVTATLSSLGNTNVGFHLNANPNKEAGTTPASWTRHNYYVLHNKIYYKADGSGASLAPTKRAPEFVPVIFDDDEEEQQELNPNGTMEVVGDGCIYDLMGRKVATREQVEDGSWKQRVATGIYILNGKKFQKK